MKTALASFIGNIDRSRHLVAIAKAVDSITTTGLDTSDILRSAIVMAISALDHFIHEVVRVGMLEAYEGKRIQTNSHMYFKIPLVGLLQSTATQKSDHIPWLDSIIRETHSWQSFQHPDKIAEVIPLISDKKIWNGVATELGRSKQDVKNMLHLIVDRRNKIAHEADLDPTNPGQKWPIDHVLTADALDTIELIGISIFDVIIK